MRAPAAERASSTSACLPTLRRDGPQTRGRESAPGPGGRPVGADRAVPAGECWLGRSPFGDHRAGSRASPTGIGPGSPGGTCLGGDRSKADGVEAAQEVRRRRRLGPHSVPVDGRGRRGRPARDEHGPPGAGHRGRRQITSTASPRRSPVNLQFTESAGPVEGSQARSTTPSTIAAARSPSS